MYPNLKSVYKNEIIDFIYYKRAIGLKYESQCSELHLLDEHIFTSGNKKILNRDIIMSYLSLKPNERITNLCNRKAITRAFLNYLIEIKNYKNIFNEIPSTSLKGQELYIPYIFSETEISKIIYYAQNYSSHTPTNLLNTRNVISCIFTMLYCTGMRIGEICNLKVQDVDIEKGLIYIREAKNNNKRIVTMSNSLRDECYRYSLACTKVAISDIYFFDTGSLKNNGKTPTWLVYYYFRKILKKSNITHLGKGKGPRVHDIRHTFCCHSLRQLSKLDGNINGYIVYLSTFMGHSSICETQDYIWITAELFADTLEKMEAYTKCIENIYKEALNEE